MNQKVNKNNNYRNSNYKSNKNNNSSKSLVFDQWPQTETAEVNIQLGSQKVETSTGPCILSGLLLLFTS